MGGFSVGLQNGIIDQKHFEALGQAIWLYIWLVNKQVKTTDKVLGGKPITYNMFAEAYPGIPRQTYMRWLARLNGTYISLLRAPHGYIVTIEKPKKWANSDVSKMQHDKKSDVSKMGTHVSKMQHDMPKNDTSNIRETIKKQRETILSTNVASEKQVFGSPEINDVFEEWKNVIGFPISSRVKQNRAAASNLIKKHGVDGVKRLINGVALAHGDRYGPNITDFSDLQSNLNKLLIWGRKRGQTSAIAEF